jgi:hypothetical protein
MNGFEPPDGPQWSPLHRTPHGTTTLEKLQYENMQVGEIVLFRVPTPKTITSNCLPRVWQEGTILAMWPYSVTIVPYPRRGETYMQEQYNVDQDSYVDQIRRIFFQPETTGVYDI